MNKLEEKVEEILNKYIRLGDNDIQYTTKKGFNSMFKELTTLIQSVQKETLEGFVRYINDGDELLIINEEEIDEYLSSIGKKGDRE